MSRVRDYRRLVQAEVKVVKKLDWRVTQLKAQPVTPKRERRIARLMAEGHKQVERVKKMITPIRR